MHILLLKQQCILHFSELVKMIPFYLQGSFTHL